MERIESGKMDKALKRLKRLKRTYEICERIHRGMVEKRDSGSNKKVYLCIEFEKEISVDSDINMSENKFKNLLKREYVEFYNMIMKVGRETFISEKGDVDDLDDEYKFGDIWNGPGDVKFRHHLDFRIMKLGKFLDETSKCVLKLERELELK